MARRSSVALKMNGGRKEWGNQTNLWVEASHSLASPRVLLLVLVVLGHVWSRVSIVRWIEDILMGSTLTFNSDR